MKPKAVIMDLGDTIIKNVEINFELGLKFLYDNIIVEEIAYDDFINFNKSLLEQLYNLRQLSKLELRFLNYIDYLRHIFKFKEDITNIEIEKSFMNSSSSDLLIGGVIPILEYFKKNRIPIYILSNSTFSSETLKHQIKKYGICNYFDEILSSSDLLFRKPYKEIFMIPINKIFQKYDIFSYDIWFIGNDYEIDIVGSSNASLFPVWYNVKGELNSKFINCLDIRNYQQLLDKFENNKGEI